MIPRTEISDNCRLGLRFSTVRKFPYKNVPKIGNNVFNSHMSIIEKTDEMIAAVENWLQSQNYSFIECNHVPDRLFGKNPKFNALLRTFFRLFPYNFRNMTRPESGLYPLTPQCLVAMLKAFAISNNLEVINSYSYSLF